MTRRNCISLAGCLMVSLPACRVRKPPPGLFPNTVAGVWSRTGLRDLSAWDAPDPVPRTSIEWLETAEYDGPGKLTARIYELTSPGEARACAERWRPSADTVFFDRGRYFVVVKWDAAERQALKNFVREIERSLPA